MEVAKSTAKAIFISDLFCNFSRILIFTALLVDEGVLPFLLHIMDAQPADEVISRITESIANMSINRKNRREISSSGIASRLLLLFDRGSSATKSNALLIMGNLLSSGLFHDKVANTATISNILENLLDIHFPKQFNAVSYCLCQLSKNEVSCEVLVQCGVIPTVLGFLRDAPTDSVDYLWTVLVNIAQSRSFFDPLVAHIPLLLDAMFEEVKFEQASRHQQWAVAMICFYLTVNGSLQEYLDPQLMESFIKTVKLLLVARTSEPSVQLACAAVLINFAAQCPESRSLILSTDLIELFYQVGLDDDRLNVRFAAILYLVSNEENCCYRLLELGIHKLLISMQDTFQRLISGAVSRRKKEKRYVKGQSLADLHQYLNGSKSFGGPESTDTTAIPASNLATGIARTSGGTGSEYDPQSEGELGKELTSAIIHNIALKRPTLAPGVLSMVLALSKNCMSLRVLHCVRALAMMSVHSKSKVALSKESRRIIPMLTVSMRSGCAEAEKVQYYAAIILCNTLALTLDKSLLQELAKDRGAVEDLVVVTLLRINSVTTKEILGKTFFNLLGRQEVREVLILQRDILSAILELAKIPYTDILELCMRTVYNITCELKSGSGVDQVFAARLSTMKVPSMMISRLVYSKENPTPGSLSTRSVRLLLGMALANMSFQKVLVLELSQIRGKPMEQLNQSSVASTNAREELGELTSTAIVANPVADAMYRVFVLGSDEATYCSVVTLYNLSRYPDCRMLAGTKALDLLNEVLRAEASSVLCRKLCISAICNFSLMAEFHEQLTQSSVRNIVEIISAPHIAMTLKIDALQAAYNLITLYAPSKAVFVNFGLISAMWKVMKVSSGAAGNRDEGSQDDGAASGDTSNKKAAAVDNGDTSDGNGGVVVDEDQLFLIVAHALKDLCEDCGTDINILRKMMTDGVMNIVLKLAKIERVELKIDMSFCIYFLTRGQENMKVLKRDSVDIVFWLTLQDMMSSHDLILRNVSRAMRSFSTGAEECKVLVKQERFFNVLKELVKSKNEDVLWQTAGLVYNIMHVESCRKKLLERGLIATIFELAASGYDHVKHVCSACLHMIPDSLPNIDDPMALELVLCLLEAQGDKFSEISEKPLDVLTYPLPPVHSDSKFLHMWSNFVASWAPYSCIVDNFFTAAYVPSESLRFNVDIPMVTQDPASISCTEKHRKMQDSDFEFSKEDGGGSTAAHSTSFVGQMNSHVHHISSESHDEALDTHGRNHLHPYHAVALSPPPAVQLPPPSFSDISQSIIESRQSLSRTQSGKPQTPQSWANTDSRVSTAVASPKVPNRSSPIMSRQQSRFAAQDQHKSLLLARSTASLVSNQPKVTLPLLKPPARLPNDTLDAIRRSGSRQNTSGKSQREQIQASSSLSEPFGAGSRSLQTSASLPDFPAAAFSYHPVMGQNQSHRQQQPLR